MKVISIIYAVIAAKITLFLAVNLGIPDDDVMLQKQVVLFSHQNTLV